MGVGLWPWTSRKYTTKSTGIPARAVPSIGTGQRITAKPVNITERMIRPSRKRIRELFGSCGNRELAIHGRVRAPWARRRMSRGGTCRSWDRSVEHRSRRSISPAGDCFHTPGNGQRAPLSAVGEVVRRCGLHLLQFQQVAREVIDVGASQPSHQVVAADGRVDCVAARCDVLESWGRDPLATPYSSGLMSPSGLPPLAMMYWFISAVSPAHIGADCEVPPPIWGFGRTRCELR